MKYVADAYRNCILHFQQNVSFIQSNQMLSGNNRDSNYVWQKANKAVISKKPFYVWLNRT